MSMSKDKRAKPRDRTSTIAAKKLAAYMKDLG